MAAADLTRLQAIADQLARDLQRAIAIDNTAFELICAGAQTGPIDEPRIRAIIERTTPPEPVPWMLTFGIASAHHPVRLPANPKFGMLPRVWVPLRSEGILTGYL